MQPADYASELRVYNKNGSLQYKYSFADSYITAVALNTDGTRAAVASTITHAGTLISRITVLDMSETEPIAEYESDGNLIFAVQLNRSGRVTAIGDTETLVSDTSYNFTPYAYDGRTVTAYTLIPSGAVVSVSNYAYGGDSTLLIFRDSAEPVEGGGAAFKLRCIHGPHDRAAGSRLQCAGRYKKHRHGGRKHRISARRARDSERKS